MPYQALLGGRIHLLPGSSHQNRKNLQACSSRVLSSQRAIFGQGAGFSGRVPAGQPSVENACSMSRPSVRTYAAAADTASAASTSQKLADLPLVTLINSQGYITPDFPEGTDASVFAIFDANKKIQYIGFSKDIRNSLRTVFSRRPDKAFFYKVVHLAELDQQKMVDIRGAWYEECGGQPPGNKLALERNQWQKPIDAGAISERGKQQAAEEQVKAQLVLIKARGCKEEFIADPAFLQNGQVDFLSALVLTPEELERQREATEQMSKASRVIQFEAEGKPVQLDLFFRHSFKTNGGFMFDVVATYDDKESTHRIIVGRDYYEGTSLQPEDVVSRTIVFLINKGVPRQTEGLLLSSQFPVNYFSISEVEQAFDDFQSVFMDSGKLLPGEDKFWRFNKIYDYGAKEEDLDSLNIAVGRTE